MCAWHTYRLERLSSPWLETEGKAQKTAGKIQNTVGGMKDAVKEAVEKPAACRTFSDFPASHRDF